MKYQKSHPVKYRIMLQTINALDRSRLKEALFKCCGSTAWVEKMCSIFPVADTETLFNEAKRIWFECNEQDWLEAFRHHSKIGDINSLKEKFRTTAKWAEGEQSAVRHASFGVLEALAEANELYEKKFGYIFIV